MIFPAELRFGSDPIVTKRFGKGTASAAATGSAIQPGFSPWRSTLPNVKMADEIKLNQSV
jgi:hypothetical protein